MAFPAPLPTLNRLSRCHPAHAQTPAHPGLADPRRPPRHLCELERPGSAGHYLADLRSTLIYEEGTLEAKANLLVVRPELFPSDYRSPEHLRLKLAAILDKARDKGLLNEHSVVALPDQIGTWLLLGGERSELYSARSLSEAQAWLVLDNSYQLAWTWLQSEGFPRMGKPCCA
ncbi:hypothetical protein ACFSHR_07020 [Azotobacter chroococcum]